MSDPVLIVGIVGLAAAVAGPYAVKAVARIRGAVTGVASVSAPGVVPSRYRWTEQEIASLGWACSQIPASVTVGEFLSKMNTDDMVSETCVMLLSPVKEVAK